MKIIIAIFLIILISCSNEIEEEIDIQIKIDSNASLENTDSSDSVIHYVRAHRSLEVKNLSFAESRFKKVVEIEPNFARGWLGLAEVSILKDNFQNASKYLDEALLLKPDLYEAVYLKGVLMDFNDQCDAFISLFEKIEITPSNRLNLLISNCFLKLQRYDDARIFFEGSDLSVIEDYDLVAENYFLQGNLNDAKKIITKNPISYKDPKYLFLNSKILIEEGKIEEAKKKIIEGIEISREPKIPFYINQGQSLLDKIKNLSKD
tara:strand:- start:35 stop:823 length:789 start_codon:yes stop_codon:yes gene_type:complete